MKNLVLASLIAASATGCIISSDSSSDAHVGATWTIRTLSSPSIPCPPGYDTAALYNQPVDANDAPVGSPIIDLFDCAAGAGTSAPLPATTYMTWIEITTHTNSGAPYAKSTPAILDVTDVDLTYNAEIYDDAGYFQLQWDLVGANSNSPLTCDQAGLANPNNSGVELTATLSGSTAAATDQFNCTDHFGITDPLAAGTYTLSVDAFVDTASGTMAVGTAPAVPNATIHDHNEITDLGNITIPIDGL
jgi:hypothetical protein